MDRGDEQVEKGELEGALASFRAAHELMRVPTTGIEVARTYAKLGKLVEARDAALEVIRMPVKPKEPRPFKVARAAAEELARELAAQIPALRIELTPAPDPDQSSLEIDQRNVPLSALGLGYALNPGEHRVQIAANGYRTMVREISLRAGETQTLRLDLIPVPKAKVVVQQPSPPKAAVQQPPPPESSTKTVAVVVPPPSEGSASWPRWVGFGLGGAGLVVGTVAGLLSLDRTRAAKEYCDGNVCPPEAQRDRDAAMMMANVSNVGLGVALLGTGIGLTSLLLSGSTPQQPSVTALRFAATPNVATVGVEGTLW